MSTATMEAEGIITAALEPIMKELRALRLDVCRLRTNPTTAKSQISAKAADRKHGKRDGTARKAWMAGLIRGREVPGPGRARKKLMLHVGDCARVLGVE